jgi:hypothetical protein
MRAIPGARIDPQLAAALHPESREAVAAFENRDTLRRAWAHQHFPAAAKFDRTE